MLSGIDFVKISHVRRNNDVPAHILSKFLFLLKVVIFEVNLGVASNIAAEL